MGNKLKSKVLGGDLQFVEIELAPGERVMAEAGTMMYMEDGISFEATMGDGTHPDESMLSKLMHTGERILTKTSIFLCHFTNNAKEPRRVAFSEPYPGKIVPLSLKEIQGEIICQKDSFLCSEEGTEVSIAFAKRLGAGFFGGTGFILQKLIGQGDIFVHACGDVVKHELKDEKLLVDTGCLVAFTKDIEYDIQRAGNLKSMFFGGEGFFLASLSGTGTVWLQSISFARLAERIAAKGLAHSH